MSSKEFEVISVLGPLGAGKTTTLNQLIENVPLGDSYAVVVNDVGENNIDAQRIWDHPANRSDKIIPLTAGCIGCSDVTQFRDALERVHEAGVNVLFIEPTGIAPGTEIADVVESSGFNLSVLTLANARTIERDMKWQVLPSQLSVADIVGITHIPDDQNETEVMAEALERLPHLPDDVAVELIKPGDTDYFEILLRLRGKTKQLRLGRQTLIAAELDHNHDHSHGISAKSFPLKESATANEIKELLLPYVDTESPLIRAKGVVDGVRFDVVGNEWNIMPDDSGLSTMNVIFGGHIPTDFMKKTKAVAKTVERSQMSGDKKAIVKSISNMSVKDRTEIALQRTEQYPHPISPLHGELIPDCEADEGYEIAFWGLNDDMPDNVKHATLNAYVSFRLSGLHELIHHPDTIANSEQKSPYWLRRYGATLGYNKYYLKEFIDDSLIKQLQEYNPAKLLQTGFMELEGLTYDESRAEEKPEFVATVCRAALQQGDLSRGEVRTLLEHALTLSVNNSASRERWQAAFAYLDSDVMVD